MKEQLQNQLAKGEAKQVLDQLVALTQQPEYAHLREEVLILSARYQAYEKSKRLGTTSYEEQSRTLAQVNQALYQIIEGLSDESTAPNKKPESIDIPNEPKGFLKPIISIVGLLAGIVAILTYCGITPFQKAAKAGNTVTVLAHGTAGKDDVVLPNRGIVKLIYGDAIIPEQINNKGEATFKQVPDAFFESGNSVEILFQDPEGEPYRAAKPDSAYTLEQGQYIGLEVRLEGMDQIHGVVKDYETGAFLEGVTVRALGVDTLTNSFGEFMLKFPGDKQQKFVTVRAFKEGYENYERSQVPTTTDREMAIPMKPQK